MAETIRRHTIDIPATAILKLLAAAILVWVWLQIWQLVMLMLVVIVLAVALDPMVSWLERRNVSRGLGATAIALALLIIIVLFTMSAGSSLVSQSRLLGEHIEELQQEIAQRAPALMRLLPANSQGATDLSAVLPYLQRAGRAAAAGAVVLVVAFVLTLYFLVEGRRTYAWLLAYVPKSRRARTHVTACEARRAILAYVAGNIATSVFATVFALVSLKLLHVPAALLLALLAGICDFVPVLGFVFSAGPAVLLAMSQSAATGLIVLALYGLYHFVENYFIAPKVYGDRLRLSNLAVLFAFGVGAEIGGVVGALLALPIAAMYPVVERLWLKPYLGRDVVEEHQEIEKHEPDEGMDDVQPRRGAR